MVVTSGQPGGGKACCTTPFTGQHLQLRTTGKQTVGRLVEAEILLGPGGHVPGHLHLRQDQRLEVPEGPLSPSLAAGTAG
jgi:hypothetical protein